MIIALDLGTRCGIASGNAGAKPSSWSVVLKTRDGTPGDAGATLLALLDREFQSRLPRLVVKEAPLHLAGFAKAANAEATVRMTYGLHMIVEAMCRRYGVKWTEVAARTVQKHFVGNGGLRREDAKAVVLARCKLLGYLDKDCADEDRADACAIFDWAASQSRAPSALHLFGEVPAPFVSIGEAAAAVMRKVRRGRAA